MTKQQETDSLRAYIDSLPEDSYLRPALESGYDRICRDIRDDMPTDLSGVVNVETYEVKELRATAAKIAIQLDRMTTERDGYIKQLDAMSYKLRKLRNIMEG